MFRKKNSKHSSLFANLKRRKNSLTIKKFGKEFFQKSTFSIFEVLILLVIAILFGILTGYIITYHRNPLDKNVTEIINTYHSILDSYYGEIDSKKLSDAAIKGMIDSLEDPYSSYMNEKTTDSFQNNVNGSFVGIGVTVQYEDDGYHRIIEVNKNGPADKAGLLVDDVIVKIDGNSVKDVSGEDFTKLVRGKKNTKVRITVKREDEEKEYTLKRNTIEIESVSSDIIDQDNQKIGYIRVDSFASNTYNQFSKALKKLEKREISSLVIDVRDNPGGYLVQVQEILSLFFPRKTVLYQIESKNVKKKILSTSFESRSYPIAVLINGGSASASEVLASCFHEQYKDSILVGNNSYGKGAVQKPQYLSNGTSIKYTTQKWLTAHGKYLEGKGIKPDYEIDQTEDYYQNPSFESDAQLQEAIKQLKESN